MRTRLWFLAVLVVPAAGILLQAQSGMQQKIGPSAVWQMPEAFRTVVLKKCGDSTQPPSFAQCFITQMAQGGAPAAAVAFTRELYKANGGGDVGIMSGFHKVGPVDIAWINYPLRANTNNGLLFVNGQPRILDVEDLKLLDQTDMQQDPQFQNTKAQFPNASVWPGDRDGTTWPNSQPGPNGGVQFTVGYPLINGCHACERVGFVMFNWNFDSQGKVLGTTFVGMTPPPVQ
jgi:hypothetical protein